MNTTNAVLKGMRQQEGRRQEWKYEVLCRAYQERDELEALNRKVEERSAQLEQQLKEQDKKAERRRREQERYVHTVLRLVGTLVLSGAVVTAAVALYLTDAIPLWLSAVVSGLAWTAAVFQAGYLWRERNGRG